METFPTGNITSKLGLENSKLEMEMVPDWKTISSWKYNFQTELGSLKLEMAFQSGIISISSLEILFLAWDRINSQPEMAFLAGNGKFLT
ncbi:hypothetical protein MRX96_058208 [Rhipicephalus microplus]